MMNEYSMMSIQYLHAVIKRGWTKLIKPPENKKTELLSIHFKVKPQEMRNRTAKFKLIVPRNNIIAEFTGYETGNIEEIYHGCPTTTDKTIFLKSNIDAEIGIGYKFI